MRLSQVMIHQQTERDLMQESAFHGTTLFSLSVTGVSVPSEKKERLIVRLNTTRGDSVIMSKVEWASGPISALQFNNVVNRTVELLSSQIWDKWGVQQSLEDTD